MTSPQERAEAALGLLCVGEGKFIGDTFPIFCGHYAHPGTKCLNGPYLDAGGGGRGCPCKENKQVSQHDEDILILTRSVPSWEHSRIDRLADEHANIAALVKAAKQTSAVVHRLSERDAREPGHPHDSMMHVWANVNDPLIALDTALAPFVEEQP